jgi:hypothetical protein
MQTRGADVFETQLLFWWDAWGATNLNGSVFRILSPVLVLIVLRTLRSVDVELCTTDGPDDQSEARVSRERERAGDLVALCKSLLTRNEIVNLSIVFVATCFPEFLGHVCDVLVSCVLVLRNG